MNKNDNYTISIPMSEYIEMNHKLKYLSDYIEKLIYECNTKLEERQNEFFKISGQQTVLLTDIEHYKKLIYEFNSLPWYKKIFKKIKI